MASIYKEETRFKPHKRLITLSPNAKHKQEDLNKAQAQSPSEKHQSRVQRNGHHEMPKNDRRQREDGDDIADPPLHRHEAGLRQDDHHKRHENRKGEGVFETPDDLSYFDKEGRVCDFLCRGTPLHVDP